MTLLHCSQQPPTSSQYPKSAVRHRKSAKTQTFYAIVSSWLDNYHERTRANHLTALRSLRTFCNGTDPLLPAITADFIDRYAQWLALRGVWSLEILNYATEMLTGGEYCPYVYDDMLSYVDPGLFCSMGDDNHNRDDSDRQSFGGSTFIAAPELTYEAVIRAMERGDFYCASGRENPPRILGLRREDDVVEIECTPATNIFFVGEGRRYGVLRGDDLTHGTFRLDPGDTWFRLAVRDRFGNTAHTHAYPARSAG